jgi:hypothetical protein
MAAKVDTSAATTSGVEDTDIAHLAGVIDGGGGITVKVIKNSNYKIGYTIKPVVRLLRSDGEDPIFGKLVAYCEEMGVKYTISEKSHGSDRGSTSTQFEVNGQENVKRFLGPIMKYLVSRYFQAEGVVDYLIPELEKGTHRTEQGFYELMELIDDIRNPNQEGRQIKYTQKFFAEEFSISQ